MRNVINNPVFRAGAAHTTFIDNTPELFKIKKSNNTNNQLLKYIGEVTVNGFPGVTRHDKLFVPDIKFGDKLNIEEGVVNAKSVFDAEGAETAMQWVKDQNRVLLTDTSMRDAHQSLFATRMRTKDMAPVIDVYDKAFPHVFSAECWGGATFDVAYRFLNEDPGNV